jgi:DNA-binding LytR/AlgR family response regulator
MPTALICDDEPLLRNQLRARLASAWPELQIVAEASNGAELLAQYESNATDVVFLDIHMPVMNGIDAAQLIGRGREIANAGEFKRTHIVFVTAYDEYAVTAFEHGAIDYVLKPYEEARLQETISRLQDRLGSSQEEQAGESADIDKNYVARLDAVIKRLTVTRRDYLQWIKASVGQTVRLIAIADVLYFQSDEKYTRVVLAETEVLIRKPIKELLEELDPERFWQIHRSTIVNTKAIAGVVRGLRDQADLKLLARPETLTVSRNFTHLFKQM